MTKLVAVLLCLALAGCDSKSPSTPAASAPSEALAQEVKDLRAAVDAVRERADRVAAIEKAIEELRAEVAAIGKGKPAVVQPTGAQGADTASSDLDRLMADVSALQARVEELAAKVEAAQEPDFRTK